MNQPFVAGNKRTSFVAAELFPRLIGLDPVADDAACVLTMLDLAAGSLAEDAFAEWLRQNTQPLR